MSNLCLQPKHTEAHNPYNLLFAVFLAGDKVHSFKMAEINLPTKDIHVQQLANVLFLLVAIQVTLYTFVLSAVILLKAFA